MSERILTFPELKPEKGIRYSQRHIARLVKKKLFPKPFKSGFGSTGSNNWTEKQIDAWIAERQTAA